MFTKTYKQKYTLFALGLSLCTQLTAATCQNITISGPPNFPPIVWSDYRETHGAASDILKKALQEHSITSTTDHVGGYRRTLKAIQRGRIHAIVGIPRNRETENNIVFINTPLYTHNLTVLVRKTMPLNEHPKTWEDLLQLKGAMPNQLSLSDAFVPPHTPKKLMRTFTPNLALKMLAIGRVDYTIYPNMQDDLLVSLLNLEGQFKKLPLISRNVPVYVGFSQQVDCDLPISKIDASIQRMIQSGESEEILNDSLYKWMNYQLNKRDTL